MLKEIDSPLAASATETLAITEVFASVQGETSLSGLPTTFIRLSACNLRCRWCDTDYSFGRGDSRSIDSLLEEVSNNGCRQVCVTGGEPLLQAGVHTLMRELSDQGFSVNLETGGSLATTDVDPRVRVILDVKCPGSGMSDRNLWSNLNHLRAHDEVKFVVADRADYDYALAVCERHQLFDRATPVLLSPVFGELDPKQLVDWMLDDKLPARLNMQMHKFIWDPAQKGV